MIRLLVTGADGQLGKSIHKLESVYPTFEFVFKSSKALDITSAAEVNKTFKNEGVQYCINCAAYTNVEKAESDREKAFLVNAEGTLNLAKSCLEFGIILIHISTDYVFNGEKEQGYTTEDTPNPINVYGASKLQGEVYIKAILERFHIIRTSWLYSEFGHNFYKTILEKAKTETVLNITDQQRGCPTNATHLASFILDLISAKNFKYGLHHFTDGVAMTWYGFAEKILKDHHLDAAVHLEKSENYRTLAKRPKNSVLINSQRDKR